MFSTNTVQGYVAPFSRRWHADDRQRIVTIQGKIHVCLLLLHTKHCGSWICAENNSDLRWFKDNFHLHRLAKSKFDTIRGRVEIVCLRYSWDVADKSDARWWRFKVASGLSETSSWQPDGFPITWWRINYVSIKWRRVRTKKITVGLTEYLPL